MIEIKNKKDCCGCCMCAGACPKECIKMLTDDEGFVYPHIDDSACVNCHLCEKVCPVINVRDDRNSFQQQGYIVQHRNPEVLRESTAGGAFTAIAEYVIDHGGVIFGVELQTDLYAKPSAAHHIWVDNKADLKKFRNSKYIQSFVGEGTPKQVKSFLEQGKYVCFSGTPCQVEGIKQYLDAKKVDQTNLILVDVVCRAVPSPLIFRKYLEHQEKKNSEHITSVRFRDKHYGYKYSTMNVISDRNNGDYHRGVESDPWLRAFFSNICDRPSCHDCKFRKLHRVSDFTIWDCFHVGRFSKELDNDRGATRMLVHSLKGQQILDAVSEELVEFKVPVQIIVDGAKELNESVAPNEQRETFFIDANTLNGYDLLEKYFPETAKVKLKRMIRMTALNIGIYSVAKKVFVRLTGKY
ncbi:Coenzyme F420 hydrogenase/dehydrogenase, beta subunit C-terminal domain [Oribacterium sp. P6A1]|uniref:Coenzyme F420 hydrogenase/dehydrogenase, beta subunit C-terminal domain n=1 Tax=Oribacterium sp. P6A1 TaxID=1410612 RepID=UPI00056B17A7|nr:Coenzyme F420 hydrogenase/dehydrogenase, beta subunit C-terminal domain [Oribacterium sp. P6A1]